MGRERHLLVAGTCPRFQLLDTWLSVAVPLILGLLWILTTFVRKGF